MLCLVNFRTRLRWSGLACHTLTICTTPFEPLIRKIAEGQGQPAIELGVIGHPVGGTSEEDLFATQVQRTASAVVRGWLRLIASKA